MAEFKFPDEQPSGDVADDEAVTLEIVDDTPARDQGRKPLAKQVDDPTDDELASYSEGVKKRINDLTHARHDERRQREKVAREAAELQRVAHTLLNENRQLRQVVNTGSQQFADTARFAAESQLDAAKRQFKEAYETGDPDQIISAQEALTDAQMQARAAKNFVPTPLQEDEYEVQQPQHDSSPELDEQTLRWQARNQWFGNPGNEDMTAFALGLHQKLVREGVDPSSDAYFERIDARLRSTFRDFFGDSDAHSPSGNGSKPPSSVVAPSTRSTGPKTVRLTQTQVSLAKRLGLTPQQYAVELVKMEKSNG